jgi:soluble lytic murein transglycosylase-like protein
MKLYAETKFPLWAVAGCLFLAAPLTVSCQVYVSTAVEGGAITLSNFQSNDAPHLLLPAVSEVVSVSPLVAKAETRLASSIPAKAERFRALVDSVASTVNVAPRLIHAVISAESNYDPRAVSPRGAIGLMQLMPATARRFGVLDPFVERDNLIAGASYLKWLMGYFRGDTELVLAAYNAGEQAVVKAGNRVPHYPETQAYVRRIMADLRSTGFLPI